MLKKILVLCSTKNVTLIWKLPVFILFYFFQFKLKGLYAKSVLLQIAFYKNVNYTRKILDPVWLSNLNPVHSCYIY